MVTAEMEKMGGLFRVTKVSQLRVARGAARAAFVFTLRSNDGRDRVRY